MTNAPSILRLLRAALVGATLAATSLAAQAAEVPPIEGGNDLLDPLARLGEPVSLITSTEVEGPYITLGDLFTGVGDRAGIPVARSPQAGRSAILDAEWLARTAQAHDLRWSPRGAFVQAVVSRPGMTVPMEDILASLRETLARHGAPADGEIHLSVTQRAMTIPRDAALAIHVSDDQYDPSSGRFSAVIEAPAGSPDAERMRLSGRVIATREIPVPLRRVAHDEVIDPHDLEYVRVRVDRLPQDVAMDAESLIGRTPRTFLMGGEPVRLSGVVAPTVIHKGALVTMELNLPGMALSAQGRAMENAGAGETLRVTNTTSNQVILATVAGPNRVVIRPPGLGPNQTASR
jgi:flagella basal body P-ring formation protein FlgA